MHIKEKCLIYPYDAEFAPVLRYKSLLKDFEIIDVVPPNGFGMGYKDAGSVDNGPVIGIKMNEEFYSVMDSCDTLIIIESFLSFDFKKVVYPKITSAAQAGKNIICLTELEEKFKQEIKAICAAKSCYFKLYQKNKINYEITSDMPPEKLLPINTPVIFIAGMAEKTLKFHIQLALRENLKKLGYNVSQVGSRHYCELLGFHSFPNFMYESSIPESKKVNMFNAFIKKIEDSEKPDIIMIGIPGGIMPLSNNLTNKYGILAFEISQAVLPDICILSILYDEFPPNYFEVSSLITKYRFGYEIDFFNLVNSQIDWYNSNHTGTLVLNRFESNFLDTKLEKLSSSYCPAIFNILNNGSTNNLTSELLNKLEKYSVIEKI